MIKSLYHLKQIDELYEENRGRIMKRSLFTLIVYLEYSIGDLGNENLSNIVEDIMMSINTNLHKNIERIEDLSWITSICVFYSPSNIVLQPLVNFANF